MNRALKAAVFVVLFLSCALEPPRTPGADLPDDFVELVALRLSRLGKVSAF
ncbi:hypothetical protein JW935_12485 [candidate division KSB1 bacterium]|nr:hypothetical protein [candidate division KSB1 bacterium]